MNKFFKAVAFAAAGITAMQISAMAADFSDMPTGDMGTAMQAAVDNNLIGGYDDNTVRPDDNITRAQMAAIIVRAFGATEASDKTFNDVADDAWYKDAVDKAVYMGAFGGDTEGNFNPENNITFQETYTVLSRVFCFEPYELNYKINLENGTTAETAVAEFTQKHPDIKKYEPSSVLTGTKKDADGNSVEYNYINIKAWLGAASDNALNNFSDTSSVADWAKDYAADVVENGGWTGIDGQLKGSSSITRGEFAYLMYNLVGTYIDSADDTSNIDSSKSIVLRGADMTLSGINTSRNLIVGYGVNNCKLTDCTVDGVTAVYGCSQNLNAQNVNEITSTTISVAGTYNDVRIMSAGISFDASGAKIKAIRGAKNSLINLGTLGG